MGRLFIGVARHVGIPAALQMLDDKDRRRMKYAIDQLPQKEWWNSDLLRSDIRQALDRLAPLFNAPTLELPELGPQTGSTTGPMFTRIAPSTTVKPQPRLSRAL